MVGVFASLDGAGSAALTRLNVGRAQDRRSHAAVILFVPASEVELSAVRDLRRRSAFVALDIAQRQTGAQVIGRPLVPGDLMGGDPAVLRTRDPAVPGRWARILQSEPLRQDQCVAVYGIALMEPTPHLGVMRLTVSHNTVGIADVGVLAAVPLEIDAEFPEQDERRTAPRFGYLAKPVVIRARSSLSIDALVDAPIAAHAERFGLLGIVAEREGDTIVYQEDFSTERTA